MEYQVAQAVFDKMQQLFLADDRPAVEFLGKLALGFRQLKFDDAGEDPVGALLQDAVDEMLHRPVVIGAETAHHQRGVVLIHRIHEKAVGEEQILKQIQETGIKSFVVAGLELFIIADQLGGGMLNIFGEGMVHEQPQHVVTMGGKNQVHHKRLVMFDALVHPVQIADQGALADFGQQRFDTGNLIGIKTEDQGAEKLLHFLAGGIMRRRVLIDRDQPVDGIDHRRFDRSDGGFIGSPPGQVRLDLPGGSGILFQAGQNMPVVFPVADGQEMSFQHPELLHPPGESRAETSQDQGQRLRLGKFIEILHLPLGQHIGKAQGIADIPGGAPEEHTENLIEFLLVGLFAQPPRGQGGGIDGTFDAVENRTQPVEDRLNPRQRIAQNRIIQRREPVRFIIAVDVGAPLAELADKAITAIQEMGFKNLQDLFHLLRGHAAPGRLQMKHHQEGGFPRAPGRQIHRAVNCAQPQGVVGLIAGKADRAELQGGRAAALNPIHLRFDPGAHLLHLRGQHRLLIGIFAGVADQGVVRAGRKLTFPGGSNRKFQLRPHDPRYRHAERDDLLQKDVENILGRHAILFPQDIGDDILQYHRKRREQAGYSFFDHAGSSGFSVQAILDKG